MEAVHLGQQVVNKLVSGEIPDEVLVSLFISKVRILAAEANHCRQPADIAACNTVAHKHA